MNNPTRYLNSLNKLITDRNKSKNSFCKLSGPTNKVLLPCINVGSGISISCSECAFNNEPMSNIVKIIDNNITKEE
jgi:hypothetical protein